MKPMVLSLGLLWYRFTLHAWPQTHLFALGNTHKFSKSMEVDLDTNCQHLTINSAHLHLNPEVAGYQHSKTGSISLDAHSKPQPPQQE